MICREFERRLEDWVDGNLPTTERAACDRHLAECPRCRELAALAGGLDPSASPRSEPPPDLASEVLARTTGAACDRARERLVPLVDPSEHGPLPAAERQLVELHLEACFDCRALRAELVALSADLPRLAELDPGSGFVDGVLERTSRRRAAPAGRLADRWRRLRPATWPGLLPRLVRRPRFAWEAAYVAVLLLTPLIASAGSPDAAAQAVERLGRAGGATVASAVRGVTEGTVERAGSVGAAAGTELRTFGTRLASSLQRTDPKAGEDVPADPDDPKEDAP